MTHTSYINSFIQKHNKQHDWRVVTSPMRADGGYIKTYAFDDGSTLTEVNRPIEEPVSVETEVKGVKVLVKTWVKLLEIECWNTDDAKSVKFYERW